MDEKLKSNLTSGEHWTRFIYMLLFGLFLYIATLLAAVLVVAQFLFALVTGAPNSRLKRFGGEVAIYIHQAWMFLTYNSEEKAFPFDDWPVMEVDDEPVAEPVVEQPVAAAKPEPASNPRAASQAPVEPAPVEPEPVVTAEVGEPEPAQAQDEHEQDEVEKKPAKTD